MGAENDQGLSDGVGMSRPRRLYPRGITPRVSRVTSMCLQNSIRGVLETTGSLPSADSPSCGRTGGPEAHTMREMTIVPWGGLSHRMFTSIFGRNFAIGPAHEVNALGERSRFGHFPVGYQFIGPARGRTAVLGTELLVAVRVDQFLHAPADLL